MSGSCLDIGVRALGEGVACGCSQREEAAISKISGLEFIIEGGVAKLLERVDWRLSRYELRELAAAIKEDISKRETLSLIESGRENCLALVAVLLMQKSSLIGDGEVVGALKMVNGKEPSARCRRLLCEALVRSESFGESKLDFSVADMGLRGVRLAVRSGYSIGPFRGSLTQWQLHCFERLSATFKIAL